MVVFTCQHCNAALKKPAVEKHYSTKCRRNPYLTCVDCLNDFHGDAYVSHTSCVSEDQRYGGANFVAKAVAVKQNSWFEVVQQCIKNNTNTKYFSIFQRLMHASNVPRKKQKFINFMSNAQNMKNTDLAGEIFDIFQKEFEKVNSKKNSENKDKSLTNGNSKGDITEDKNKSEKKRNQSTSESDAEKGNPENGEINESKKNKSKKQKTENGNSGALEEVDPVSNDNDNPEDSPTNKAEKKKKKNKSKGSNKENVDEESNKPDDTNISQEENPDQCLDAPNTTDVTKLSKKELKKLKKKQKYEAELKQIEEQKLIESNVESKDDPTEAQPEKSESRKKKRKANLSESEPDNKKKKGNIIETAPEEVEKDTNKEELDIPQKNGKFHWDQVIKEILQNSSDQEMSLKRLSKKVLAEYQAVKGEREGFGDLMSKFNKKINKIPGVRILKDKAKLLPTEE